MPRVDPEFGKAVAELFKELGLSLRQVRMRTGINHTTLHEMSHGLVPGTPETIIRFANGLGLNPNEWLSKAGYDYQVAGYAPVDSRPTIGMEKLLDGLEALVSEFGDAGIQVHLKPGDEITPETAEVIVSTLRGMIERARNKEGE